MLLNKIFAPEFCSIISNWFDMREQAPGANLLHESVSGASSFVCTEICLPCKTREQTFCCATNFFARNRWCRRGSFAPGACRRSVLREQTPSSCPSYVLVGVLTQERVSEPCFRSKLPRVYRPLRPSAWEAIVVFKNALENSPKKIPRRTLIGFKSCFYTR